MFIGGAGLSDQDFAIKLFSARRRSSVANAADSTTTTSAAFRTRPSSTRA
ncbi:hypothetical protein ACPA9J_05925 [Pseudomonas aeruginosa]